MKSTTKRTQRDYAIAFKLGVVDQVEQGELTNKQAQNKYGIQGCSAVLIWLRKHGRLDRSIGTPIFLTQGFTMNKPKHPPTPEQRITDLEQELTDGRLKAQFFEAVVNQITGYVSQKTERAVIQQKTVTSLATIKACELIGMSRQAYYNQCIAQVKRS